MLSEGVLAADVVWDREVEDLIEVVRFVYQRFADYRIAGALLDQYGSEKEFRAALQPGQSLRTKVRTSPAGWIAALSVLVRRKPSGAAILTAWI